MKINLDNNQKKGVIGASLFIVLTLAFLILTSLKPPFPPPPQIGVEVNLGNSNDGRGDVQPDKPKEVSTPQPQPKPTPTEEKVITSDIEKTVNMKNSKKAAEKVEPKVEPVEEKPVIEERRLYKKKTTTGGSEGDTDKDGDKGMEHGDPNAKNYVGDGGSGGVSYDLGGRKAKALPKPNKSFDEEGRVIVKIWVDKYGKVTNVRVQLKGSTTTNQKLHDLAMKAAMKAKFDVKPDAPEVQVGTITYDFVLLN